MGPVWAWQACQTLVVSSGTCSSHQKTISTPTQNHVLYLVDELTSRARWAFSNGPNHHCGTSQLLKYVHQALEQKEPALVNRYGVLFPHDNARHHGSGCKYIFSPEILTSEISDTTRTDHACKVDSIKTERFTNSSPSKILGQSLHIINNFLAVDLWLNNICLRNIHKQLLHLNLNGEKR